MKIIFTFDKNYEIQFSASKRTIYPLFEDVLIEIVKILESSEIKNDDVSQVYGFLIFLKEFNLKEFSFKETKIFPPSAKIPNFYKFKLQYWQDFGIKIHTQDTVKEIEKCVYSTINEKDENENPISYGFDFVRINYD